MTENKKVLYRYRHLQGKHRERTKRILTESVLYFANPITFNDPFDCKVHFQPSFSVEELKRKYLDLMKERMPDLNRKQRRSKATDNIRDMKPDKFLSEITANLQDSVDNVGVLSFSATDHNILLWSHYAAGHTGLCLKFIAIDRTPFFGLPLPVSYVPTYPKINVLDSADKQIDAFLLTKANDWSYEKEWRIIDHHGAGDKVFLAELLVGVVFGARMTAEDKREVVEWVRESKSPIEIFQASPASGSFSLEIRLYK